MTSGRTLTIENRTGKSPCATRVAVRLCSNLMIGFPISAAGKSIGAKREMFMAIAVIPARYSATRFPGKPLVSLAGKPMIQRVWERAAQAKRISRVVIATDDERIVKAAAGFGAEAVMTRPDHRSGTERVAEVAVHLGGADEEVFVNVQGDEPLVEPEAIDTLVEAI